MKNNIRKGLLAWSFLLIPLGHLAAQTYTVYSVIGSVKHTVGGKLVAIKPRNTVKSVERLTIGQESAVTILDEKRNTMFSLTIPGTHTVSQLISRQKSKSQSLSKQYMSYLVKQLFSPESQKMTHPETYMHATATSFRSTSNDSLLLNRIVSYVMQSVVMAGFTPEEALFLDPRPIGTDFNVSFDLISCDSNRELNDNVRFGSSSYIRVTNDEPFAIYVNILNLDAEGNKYLVLPVDEACTCAHLMIPPKSTVRFNEEPFIFPDKESKEMFMLIATKEPVDFSILLNPMKPGNAGAMRAGIHRKYYKVQKK